MIFLFHFTTFHAYVRLDIIGTLFLPIVLVFYCHCNKRPWTLWFKTTQVGSLPFLKVRSLKVKMSARLHSFWKLVGKSPFSCLSYLPEAAHILWLVAPFFIFKTFHSRLLFLSCFILLPLTFLTSYQHLCDYIGLSQSVQFSSVTQ